MGEIYTCCMYMLCHLLCVITMYACICILVLCEYPTLKIVYVRVCTFYFNFPYAHIICACVHAC